MRMPINRQLAVSDAQGPSPAPQSHWAA